MTDHEGGDMSDDIPNWDWVSLEEKDAEIAKLKADLEEARKVMKPFADYGDIMMMRGMPEDPAYSIFGAHGKVIITFGDFRRARAFLDKAWK